MKKSFQRVVFIAILTIIFTTIISFSSAITATITYPGPQNNPFHINVSQTIDFDGTVRGGVEPHSILWRFCPSISNCTPETYNSENPGEVNYSDVGTYLVYIRASDSDAPTNEDNDTIIVIVEMTHITRPANNTRFNTSENITFEVLAKTKGLVDVTWGFGEGTKRTNISVPANTAIKQTFSYDTMGIYSVNVNISDGFGNTDSKTITLFIYDPISLQFGCQLRFGACMSDEIELLRFYDTNNSHALGFDHPNASLYDYGLCCNTTVSAQVSSSQPGNPSSVYAVLQNDSESAISGGHRASGNNSITSYYYLEGFFGEGISCQTAVNTTCAAIGLKCVYEYYNPSLHDGGSHFAECVNIYDNLECCGVAEDCTNNFDDDGNGWSDTADNDFRTNIYACSRGTICGNSDQELITECEWTTNYCSNGNCDFSNMGVPAGYYNQSGIAGYVVEDYFTGCKYINDTSGNIVEHPSNSGCPGTPPFLNDWNADSSFESMADTQGVSRFELFNRCNYFYCSDGENNTLSPFVEDMENNGQYAKHICAFNEYWDPGSESCIEITDCYEVTDNSTGLCQSDFLNSGWIADSMPNDLASDQDCFDNRNGYNERACCPIFSGGSNRYSYLPVQYFIVE